MKLNDMLTTFKAVEFMFYGLDISQFDYDKLKGYYNKRDKTYISRLSPNVEDFVIELDDECKDFLNLYNNFVVRREKTYECVEADEKPKEPDLTLNKELMIKTMQTLYKLKIVSYDGVEPELLDPELRDRLAKIDREFVRNAPQSCDMIDKLKLSATKKYFEIMTAVSYANDKAVLREMLAAYDKVYTSFDIEGFKDYQIYDNRLYIPLSEADMYRLKSAMGDEWKSTYNDLKYIVISKNLYDYYYCSYGSEFQSCYSVTSDYLGWYGMFPFGTFKDHYIIYATKDHAQKTSMDASGSKWVSPYMFWRCWGWVGESGKLLVDKTYPHDSRLFASMQQLLLDLGMSLSNEDLRQGKKMRKWFKEHPLKMYSDSIKFDTDKLYFRRGSGSGGVSGAMPYFKQTLNISNLKSVLNKIKEVSTSFIPSESFKIIDGKLFNPKRCPMTNLFIDVNDKESFYAKFLIAPVKSFACVTYIDGCVKVDTYTDDDDSIRRFINIGGISSIKDSILGTCFNSPCYYTPLKNTKDFLKGNVNKLPFDIILLRVVENDKVTYIKYKKDGVK